MVDFLLCVIWLPIGVSKTYGFRTRQEVFTQTCKSDYLPDFSRLIASQITEQERLLDGTGSCLCKFLHLLERSCLTLCCSLFTAGTMIGFDASGHIAEETKNAR